MQSALPPPLRNTTLFWLRSPATSKQEPTRSEADLCPRRHVGRGPGAQPDDNAARDSDGTDDQSARRDVPCGAGAVPQGLVRALRWTDAVRLIPSGHRDQAVCNAHTSRGHADTAYDETHD